jgi:hypothetical protein
MTSTSFSNRTKGMRYLFNRVKATRTAHRARGNKWPAPSGWRRWVDGASELRHGTPPRVNASFVHISGSCQRRTYLDSHLFRSFARCRWSLDANMPPLLLRSRGVRSVATSRDHLPSPYVGWPSLFGMRRSVSLRRFFRDGRGGAPESLTPPPDDRIIVVATRRSKAEPPARAAPSHSQPSSILVFEIEL